MATEKSIYEGKIDERLSGFTCLGKITFVDAAKRTCRVKTIGMKGKTHDLDLPNVQWISLSAATDGSADEDTSVPRPGQMGVITFINNEPYIMGYYRPINPPPEEGETDDIQDPNDTQEQLVNNGDRILRTIAGNRIILRSGGSVEIESNKLCRTYWIPSKKLINTVCGDYELETEGGFMYWTRDPDTDETQLRYFVYDQLEPENTMDLQIGTTDDEDRFVNLQIGAAGEGDDIPVPAFDLGVGSDGTTEINIGTTGQFHMKIDGDTGDVEMTTQGNVTQTIDGDVTQTVHGGVTQTVDKNVDQTVTGNVSATISGTMTATVTGEAKIHTDADAVIDAGGKATVTSGANTEVTAGGDAKITASGNCEVKASKINLNGSASGITTADSHQQVIDFITGVPVMPSTTVFSDI